MTENTCAILCSGPSMTHEDALRIKELGIFTFGTNSMVFLEPWINCIVAHDSAWWNKYLPHLSDFRGKRLSNHNVNGCEVLKGRSWDKFMNSGSLAVAYAIRAGYKNIILLGADCSLEDGYHCHGEHPQGMSNCRSVNRWSRDFAYARQLADEHGARIINASRKTTLKCFERAELEQVIKEIGAHIETHKQTHKTPMLIRGMHGLGDNLHQRGVIRNLINNYEIWIETPWPCLYHDMDIKLISKGSRLRTQAKNAKREAGMFSKEQPPSNASHLDVSYSPSMVRHHGSVFAAMLEKCGISSKENTHDFSFPIPDAWMKRADDLIASWGTDKPIMIYRPLVDRKEWGGCQSRNPDIASYQSLFESISDRYFVVSVADLVKCEEWMVSNPVRADIEYHKGELDIEILSALFKRASLVFASPGFATILAQSVGTPSVCVFGGYENSKSFSGGAHLAPYLGIDPIVPCDCFSHRHNCRKAIDMDDAINRLQVFVEDNT